ncbi:alpha-2-macroglobulin [Nanoarchaeota archaeon]
MKKSTIFTTLLISILLILSLFTVFAVEELVYDEEINYYFSLNVDETLTTSDDVILSLWSTNVPTVDVSIYKVDIDNLLEQGMYNLEEVVEGLNPIKTIKIDLEPQGTGYQEDYKRFSAEEKIDLDDPGVYVFIGNYRDKTDDTMTIISDLGVISKNYEDKLEVYTFNVKTGKSMGKATVKGYKQGDEKIELAFSKTTDSNGELKMTVDDEIEGLSAEKDGHFAFFSTYFRSSENIENYVYTDRPVYRPGQTVYWKAILLNNKAEKEFYSDQELEIEVFDSQRNSIYKKSMTTDELGQMFDNFNLDEEAHTGSYRIDIKKSGERYSSFRSHTFTVQEYVKPEFEVTLTPDKNRYVKGEKGNVEISAQYFFGSPVKDAVIEYKIYKTNYWYYPCYGYRCMYEDYMSEDIVPPYYYDRGELVDEGEIKTDSNGMANVDFKAKFEDDRYYYQQKYIFEAEVTDASRKSNIGTTSVKIVPAEFKIELQTDKYGYEPQEEVQLTVRTKDYDENNVNKDVNIKVFRHWYDWEVRNQDREQGIDRGYDYYRHEEKIFEKDITTVNGDQKLNFNVEDQGNYKIIATSEDSNNNDVEREYNIWVYDRNYRGYYENLNLRLDKDIYYSGETARLVIESPVDDAEVFFSIEGKTLFKMERFHLSSSTKIIEIPIEKEYAPNAFANVIVIKDGTVYQDQISINVPPEENKINVRIIPKYSTYRPGETAEFKIITLNHKNKSIPARFSFGLVDEAIYSIKEDNTEDIFSFFNKPEGNSVSTSYSFYRYYGIASRMGGGGMMIEEATLDSSMDVPEMQKAIDGGDDSQLAPTEVRKFFPDTVRIDFDVDSDGEELIELTLPDSLTTFRATVKALTPDFKFGQATEKIITRKNVMARLITPRFITQEDSLIISGVIHNYLAEQKDFHVNLEADDLIFENEDNQKLVTIAAGESERIDWKVKADKCCSVNVTLYAFTDIESDAMQLTIPIMPKGVKETQFYSGEVENQEEFNIFIPDDIIDEASTLKLTLSPSVAGPILDSLEYLVGYPYGCTEQTMSRFLPSVIVGQTLKELDLEDEKLEKELPLMVGNGTKRLKSMQHSDGGWGWWKHDDSHPFMTAYVIYGLTIAQNAGYDVDNDMLEEGLDSLKRQYKDEQIDANTKIYMLYVLSFHESVDNYVIPSSNELSDYGKAILALSYKNSNMEDMGQNLIDQILENKIIVQDQIHWSSKTFRYSWRYNDVETTSYVLKALIAYNEDEDIIQKTVQYLIRSRKGTRWHSTKDTASVVFALTDYLKETKELNPDYNIKVYQDGELVKEIEVNKDNMFEIDNVLLLNAKSSEIKIIKDGTGKLYYGLLSEYFRKMAEITALDNGFKITRSYDNLKPLSGEDIEVRLTIETEQDLEYVHIEEPIPAGTEFSKEEEDYWYYGWYTQRDVRDEKLDLFYTRLREGKHTITYKLKAIVPGEFSVMPTYADLMYEPQINGHSESEFIIIEDNPKFYIPKVVIQNDKIELDLETLIIDVEGSEGTIILEDDQGNEIASQEIVLTAQKESVTLETGSLEEGSYTLKYTVTVDGDDISGEKPLTIGIIEAALDDKENTEYGQEYEKDQKKAGISFKDVVIFLIGFFLIIIILLIMLRMYIVKEKKRKMRVTRNPQQQPSFGKIEKY